MKTAMQELIDELKLIEAYPMLPLVLKMATELLEKEKEQIIQAHIDGFDHIVVDFKKQEYAEQYYNETYNQTYNQNK
jgi:hypothetical protein